MVSWDVTDRRLATQTTAALRRLPSSDFSLVVDFGVRVVAGGDESGGEHGVSRGGGCRPVGLRAVALLLDLRVHGSEVRSRRPACRRR